MKKRLSAVMHLVHAAVARNTKIAMEDLIDIGTAHSSKVWVVSFLIHPHSGGYE